MHGTSRTTRPALRTAAGAALVVVGALALSGTPALAAPVPGGARGSVDAGPRTPQVVGSDTSPGPRVLTTSPGRPLARPSGVPAGASPATVATAVVRARATELGVRGTLTTASVQRALGGGHVVRLAQSFDGVPVIGGEVVVDVDDAGRTRSAISETLPGTVPSTTATVSRAAATSTITALIAKYTEARADDLVVSAPELALYDASMLGAPSAPAETGARLVWKAEVTSTSDLALRRLLLLDARTSKVALHVDLITTAKNRSVCDNENVPADTPGITCVGTAVVRSEGQGPLVSRPDVNAAYEHAGLTYDFYLGTLDWDSVDGAGLPLRSTVRYCFPDEADEACPYDNAFWNGTQMVYGEGYAAADDVVAHEITHGVTERVNGLFYYFQSGAINESLSDIFGEFVDLTDGVGTDTAETRWKMGEDLAGGAIRDMQEPGLFGDPDSTSSPAWDANVITADDAFDAGGVHGNSGVGNKFAYLLTDGDTFNGVAVAGIGIPKAATIIFRASQSLTSASDYRGLAAALRASCSALQGTGAVTPADCASVEDAITAVEMDSPPAAVTVSTPSLCPTGTVSATRWNDTLDNPASGRWTVGGTKVQELPSGTLYPTWFYGGSNTYYGPRTASHYAGTKGGNNLWGDDLSFGYSDSNVAMRSGVAIPSGTTYLRFDHAFGFETDREGGGPLENFDGGVVEYSTNGSAWKDAGPLMAGAGSNGYGFNTGLARGGTRITTSAGNPLAGRAAFTWQSQGYVTSRAVLSSLAGTSVRFRFRIGTDQAGGDYGWFVDNVRIYSCVPLLQLQTPSGVVTKATTLTWAANDRSSRTTSTYRIAAAPFGGPLSAYGSTRAAPSTRALQVPLTKAGTTCVAVRSTDPGAGLTASGTRCFTLPVDDRSLTASKGWTRATSSGAFSRTLRVATTKGRTLKLAGARGGHLTVLARAVKRGGKVGVYVGGRRIATIALSATRSTARRFSYTVAVAGPVKLKVLSSGRPVTIDGIAVSP